MLWIRRGRQRPVVSSTSSSMYVHSGPVSTLYRTRTLCVDNDTERCPGRTYRCLITPNDRGIAPVLVERGIDVHQDEPQPDEDQPAEGLHADLAPAVPGAGEAE